MNDHHSRHGHAPASAERTADPGAAPVGETSASDAAPSVEASRRRFERIRISTPVEVYPGDDVRTIGSPFDALAIDIGRGGLCLRCRRPLIPGMRVFVRMPIAKGRWKLMYGEIRHSAYADNLMYRIGLQFMPIPHESEFQNWIEHLTRKFGGGDF